MRLLGVPAALGWPPYGGDVMFIGVGRMPGGGLTVTGRWPTLLRSRSEQPSPGPLLTGIGRDCAAVRENAEAAVQSAFHVRKRAVDCSTVKLGCGRGD